MPPVLSRPPPSTRIPNSKGYGKYYIKANGKVISKSGHKYIDVTGFDTSMDIVSRVEKVVKKKADSHDMLHTEVQLFFVNGTFNIPDGTIYANYIESGSIITFPPSSFY